MTVWLEVSTGPQTHRCHVLLTYILFLFLIWRVPNIWNPGYTEGDYFTCLCREDHICFSLPASKVNSGTSALEAEEKRRIWESDHIRPASHIPGQVCRKQGEKSLALEDMREEFCTESKCNFEHLHETRLFTHYVEKLWNTAKRTTVSQEKEECVFHENPKMGKPYLSSIKTLNKLGQLRTEDGPTQRWEPPAVVPSDARALLTCEWLDRSSKLSRSQWVSDKPPEGWCWEMTMLMPVRNLDWHLAG